MQHHDSRHRPRRLAAALALGMLASCMSYTTQRDAALDDVPTSWDRLPYHVAIIPVDGTEVIPTTEGKDRSGSPYEFTFSEFPADGSDILTQSLRDALEASAFRRVTILQPPSASDGAMVSDELRSTYWATAAREAQADLLLDIESFTYPVKPSSSAKPLSFFLYLFGPIELLFPDREYSFDEVNLAVSLYEVEGLDAPRFRSCDHLLARARAAADGEDIDAADEVGLAERYRLNEGTGALRQFRVTPGDLSYRFGDRLGKSPASASFWPSILIPSAFLAKNSDHFSTRVTKDTALALGHDLARDIVDGDYEYIVRPSSVGNGLLFDARDATLGRSSSHPGVLELRARIRKPTTPFDRTTVWVAGRRYEIELDPAVTGTQMNTAIAAAFQRGSALATTSEADRGDEFDHDLVVYLPDPGRDGLVPASSPDVSERALLDVVQLRLGERLGARGNRARTWTFDLEGVVDDATLEALRAERPAAPRAQGEPVRVSMDTESGEE